MAHRPDQSDFLKPYQAQTFVAQRIESTTSRSFQCAIAFGLRLAMFTTGLHRTRVARSLKHLCASRRRVRLKRVS